MALTRRTFLSAGAAGVFAASRTGRALATARRPMPLPTASGIDHIIVVCMENRSFDHYLGWVAGADGRQAGLSYLDDAGVAHSTHHLTDWQGCGFTDPDHSYEGGRVQYNNGALDGFRKGGNDDFALGYYTEADLPLHAALVRGYTVFDGWHASILGPTYPNRLYTHSAQTDRISNTMTVSTMPTIWDRLAAANVSRRYYFSDIPVLALYGTKYLDIAAPVASFFVDAAAGTLPSYSYIDPSFLGEDQGGTNDDHPHADIRRGMAFLSSIVRAVTSGPKWSRTALFITYDEWGGFFDHVAPPSLPDAFTPTATEEHNTAGFRVPTYLVSPFARRRHIPHGQYDHSSILKAVEWRFGLAPLTPRDAAARNPFETLVFDAPPNLVPAPVPVVADPGPHLCGAPAAPVGVPALPGLPALPGAVERAPMAGPDPMWVGLRDLARDTGWLARV